MFIKAGCPNFVTEADPNPVTTALIEGMNIHVNFEASNMSKAASIPI